MKSGKYQVNEHEESIHQTGVENRSAIKDASLLHIVEFVLWMRSMDSRRDLRGGCELYIYI